jgi:glycosyltransferase involved in cell wall biosynthesis
MSAPPLVSVVIPVFNGARFVERAVESVRAQTYRPIQLIVVDDGSTDRSADIVALLSVDRFVEIGENRGVSTARNIGTALAEGSFVTYLDADDVMTPDKVTRQMDRLLSEPPCDCVFTQQTVVIDDGAPLPQWLEMDPAQRERLTKLPISALIRLRSLIVSGGFDPRFRTSEEMDVLMRLSRSGAAFDELPVACVERHIHGANASYAHDQMSSDLLRVMAPLARRPPPPLVSVIIPVRDRVDYLGEAIASIRAQEGVRPEEIEIIVVDDGSFDERVVADAAADVTGITRQPPLGIGVARNHGVLLSRGQHLAFLDYDDLWASDKLATQLALLRERPELDAVFGVIEEFVSPELERERSASLHARDRAIGRLPGAMLVRRDAFASAGFFPVGEDGAEAAIWYASAIDAGLSMADVDHLVLRRRLHGSNYSLHQDTIRRSYPRALKEILDRRRRETV